MAIGDEVLIGTGASIIQGKRISNKECPRFFDCDRCSRQDSEESLDYLEQEMIY